MIGTLRAVACSAAVAGYALLFLSGCSIIGLGVGAGIDAPRSIRDPRRLLRTPPGTRVKLKLRDGTELRGAFAGMNSAAEGEPATLYAARYEDWRLRKGTLLGAPALGETLIIAQAAEGAFRGVYRGFNVGTVAIRPIVERGAGSMILRPETQWIDGSGREVFSRALLVRLRRREVPVRDEIGIDLGNATRLVPYDSVSSAKIRGVHSAKTILFWMGLATDVSILIFGSVGNPSSGF